MASHQGLIFAVAAADTSVAAALASDNSLAAVVELHTSQEVDILHLEALEVDRLPAAVGMEVDTADVADSLMEVASAPAFLVVVDLVDTGNSDFVVPL